MLSLLSWNVPLKYVREPDWYAMRQRWKLAAKRFVLLAPASQKFCLRESRVRVRVS